MNLDWRWGFVVKSIRDHTAKSSPCHPRNVSHSLIFECCAIGPDLSSTFARVAVHGNDRIFKLALVDDDLARQARAYTDGRIPPYAPHAGAYLVFL